MLEITLVNAAHYSRLDSVERMFKYFQELPCSKIHVTKNKDNINFPTYNFNIIENDGNWVQRLHAAFQMVKTPYIMMINEDDIYNFDYIINSINFLNENKDYVATWGMRVFFKNKKIYTEDLDTKKYFKQIKQNYSTNNRIDSIEYYLNYENHFTLHNNVIRSDIFKKLYFFLNNNTIYHSIGYTDRIGIITAGAFGNIKTLDCLHIIKDRNGNIRNCPTEKHLHVKYWNKFCKENTKFCNFISKEAKLDLNNLKNAINKIKQSETMRKNFNFQCNSNEVEIINKLINKNIKFAELKLNQYYNPL